MNEPPRRTRTTSLSDDELLVYDALFDGYCATNFLRASIYPLHLNVTYTHSLSDQELAGLLEDSAAQGLLWRKDRCVAGQLHIGYVLSELGGALWEQERSPDWARYVRPSLRELGLFAHGCQRVCGANESICRQYAGAMFGAGIIVPTGSIRIRRARNVRLIPWRSFPQVYVLRFPTKNSIHDMPRRVDTEAFEASRGGWSVVSEIQRCNETPPRQWT